MEYFAEYFRPKTFDDIVGQKHLVSKDSVLRKTIEQNLVFNMIFYGPPGTGKSTIANIIANTTQKDIVKMNKRYYNQCKLFVRSEFQRSTRVYNE